jgi:predicted nucleotidyltransferase
MGNARVHLCMYEVEIVGKFTGEAALLQALVVGAQCRNLRLGLLSWGNTVVVS